MTWYAAHNILGMKRTDGVGPISVWESVLLIEARTVTEAHAIAAGLGEEEAKVDDGLTLDGVAAVKIFAGVRKLTAISNPHPHDAAEDRPTTGTEITYSTFRVTDEDALRRLAGGDEVELTYEE